MPGNVPDEELAWAKRMISRYVKKSPCFLHPDRILVKNVLEGLAINKARYGKGYCPCRPVEGNPERDAVNICPCRDHKADIKRNGTCECGIFVSKEFLGATQRS